jgi:hypothetical protein
VNERAPLGGGTWKDARICCLGHLTPTLTRRILFNVGGGTGGVGVHGHAAEALVELVLDRRVQSLRRVHARGGRALRLACRLESLRECRVGSAVQSRGLCLGRVSTWLRACALMKPSPGTASSNTTHARHEERSWPGIVITLEASAYINIAQLQHTQSGCASACVMCLASLRICFREFAGSSPSEEGRCRVASRGMSPSASKLAMSTLCG